jgi:signal transduction histidine kinase
MLTSAQAPARILIVEDELLLVEELQDQLGRLGYAIAGSATTGKDAVALAATTSPSLVLMDIRLKGPMDGIEAAALIRQRHDIPIVFLTGNDDDSTFMRAKDVAPFGYLSKPLVPRDLRTTVALALQQYAASRETKAAHAATLEEKAALAEFTSGASHDLRSPLGTIRSLIYLLEVEGSLTPDQAELIAAMDDTATRMSDLLESLLALARLREPAHVPVELSVVLRDAIADLRATLDISGGEIRAEELPAIEGDRSQLHRLFLNLLGNALKFSTPGVAPIVTIRTKAEGGVVTIEIEDNGIGFPADKGDLLFKPFQRLHARSEYEGTGLGLAACARIASLHGGSIAARPGLVNGAVFTVTLPLGGTATGPRSTIESSHPVLA